MGMSSSQARLLAITSRKHDLEYRSQCLANVKTSLSRQSDSVSEEYLDALDKKYIQMKVIQAGESTASQIDASFNSMCMYTKGVHSDQYLLENEGGSVYVTQEVMEAYEAAHGDSNAFALTMLECGADTISATSRGDSGYSSAEIAAINAAIENVTDDTQKQRYKDRLADLQASGNAAGETIDDLMSDLGLSASSVVENYAKENGETIDASAYAWYVNMFEGIKEHNGKMEVLSAEQQNDNEWLSNMVQCGYITLNKYDNTGTKGWQATSFSTDTDLVEVSNDVDIKKAEVKYEYETKKINDKEKRIDQELKNIETEHEALKTEEDSIKQVIKDNIEKTFNLFS